MDGFQESYSNRKESVLSPVSHLSKAVESDPRFALAHATLSRASAHLYFEFDPQRSWLDSAEYHCAESLRLDPALPEGHLARAAILWSPTKNFQHAETIATLEQALAAQPNLERAHNLMCAVCWHIGRLEEARLAHERARRTNAKTKPRNLSWIHLCGGDFVAAKAQTEIRLHEGGDTLTLAHLAYCALLAEDLDSADHGLEAALRQMPDEPLIISCQAMLHARRGETSRALDCIQRSLGCPRSFGHMHHVYNQVACAYSVLGETDKAMGWLERTADTGFPCWPFFLADPFLKELHSKLEFTRLIDDLRRTYTAIKIKVL